MSKKGSRLVTLMAAITIIGCLLILSACSTKTSTTSTSSVPTSTTNGTITSTTSTTQAVALSVDTNNKSGIGEYLVDGKGMTLYWTTGDLVGVSNITGATLANWPVFYAVNMSFPASLSASDFSSFTRADGTNMQTTFKGWPLYYYIKDASPGDTLGQGVANVWFVVNPTASGPAAPGTNSTTSSTTSTTTTTPSTTTTTTSTTTTGGAPVTISLIAKNISFNMSTITVSAGASVTINFNNQDSVPHNFSLFTNSSANPPALFQGQVVSGPGTATYTFTAPTTPGTYFFRCDIHPTMMTGSFIVQ